MRQKFVILIRIMISLVAAHPVLAQPLFFRHLGHEQGMKGLLSHGCTLDHYGFIWVATGDGLVKFDGKEVTYFFHQTHPGLPQDEIGFIFCDSRNHLWASTRTGVVRIDERREFKRQIIVARNPEASVRMCFEDSDGRMYASTEEGIYALTPGEEHWTPELWLDSLLSSGRVREFKKFDDHRFLVVIPGTGIYLVHLKEKKMEVFFPVQDVITATRFDDKSILVGCGSTFRLLHLNLDRPDSPRIIPPPSFFQNDNLQERIFFIVRAADFNVYMTTNSKGLVSLDSSLTMYRHYDHDPVDPLSLSTHAPRYLYTDSIGNILMTSVDGVNYTNVHNKGIEYFNYFRTDDGQLIQNRVLSVTDDRYDNLWICIRDNVLVHNRKTNTTRQIHIPSSAGLNSTNVSPMYVTRDKENRIWLALRGDGIAVFDDSGKYLKLISSKDYPGYGNFIDHPRVIRDGLDGYMYIGTDYGLLRIHSDGFRIDTFANEEALQPLLRKRIVDIYPVDNGLWISSSPDGAAYHYSFRDKKRKTFNTRNGLVSNRVYEFTSDGQGNIYAGTYSGLSIIDSRDSIVNLEKGKGLISARIESIETADDGSVWMTNNYNLLKYDPVSGEIFRLGSRQGLTNINFTIMASAKLASGQLAFGANKGLIIVDPAIITFENKPLKVFAFLRDSDGKEIESGKGQKLRFNYRQQDLHFNFAVNDIMIADQVLYRYRLSKRLDGRWSNPSLAATVDFSLDPGDYTLEVEAHLGQDWYALDMPVRFRINPPWWNQWWFICLLVVILTTGVWLYLRGRINALRNEVQVSRQIAELESRALKAQMNPHFVFNSLNAIQECIVTGRIDEAYSYLSQFSKLLRMVLEQSEMQQISLHDELEVLQLYISLEKLRFKEEMVFRLILDDDLDTEEIWIPPMLIQPHLENAIWHGLRHKQGDKALSLSLKETHPGYLEVRVEDDGIGVRQSMALRHARLGTRHHTSKGKQLSENRMALLRKNYPLTTMKIIDLYEKDGQASGTRVELRIPMLSKKPGKLNIPKS